MSLQLARRRDFLEFEQARAHVRKLNLPSLKAWQAWAKGPDRPPNIPAGPAQHYKDQGWVSLGDWLGTGTVAAKNRPARPFVEARSFVQALKLRNQREWHDWAKGPNRPPDIPSNPSRRYGQDGWAGWADWLGTGRPARKDRTFRPFEDAQTFAQTLNLTDSKAWYAWAKGPDRPTDIPSNPQLQYAHSGWQSWGDWLGTGFVWAGNRTFLSFEEGRAYVRKLDLPNDPAWRAWARGPERPTNIPAGPANFYSDLGWAGMADWLGLDSPNHWSVSAIRVFVASLAEHLPSLTPAELYVLFQQNGLWARKGQRKAFAKALVSGRLHAEELAKFARNEPSTLDEFFLCATDSGDDLLNGGVITGEDSDSDDEGEDELGEVRGDDEISHELPIVQTNAALAALDRVTSSADEEAVAFLVASAVGKTWKHAFLDESEAVDQAERATGNEYVQRAKEHFLDEYSRSVDFEVPAGYAFEVEGQLTSPNLMQRLGAVRVRDDRRVGNWSGTGAGKTLSVILASRLVDARLTVICCPNSVVEGWRQAILGTFPDSIVATKTFQPFVTDDLSSQTGFELPDGPEQHRYLVLNYEAFQRRNSAADVRSLVEAEKIDLVIVDEIQYVKQRGKPDDLSQRRRNVAMLTSQAGERNPDLRVVGMSATPVINNLMEGRSLVELVTGVDHPELTTQPTVANCMMLHQRLTTVGIRWMPDYPMKFEEIQESVDCSAYLDQIRALSRTASALDLELILTRARLPMISKHLKKKTLIYTHLVTGIEKLLRDAVQDAGFTVGSYTGEDKSGLQGFLHGDVDVLIGTSAIGTGVDGLQHVCDTLIMNVLPWTAAEFEQIKGRIFRQGQRADAVKMVLPLTFADVHGERWSWCESKMQRLHFKRSIADAAVDGVVPVGHLRSESQALKDVMGWLKRLDDGKLESITRHRIVIPLPSAENSESEQPNRRYSEFSAMNHRWNQSRSDTTHLRLLDSPDEWLDYHSRYREARSGWPVVPYEEVIRYYADEEGLMIGDFGCGEAKIADALAPRHTVHSFDHVAIDERVIACDMSHVPLENNSLDAAVFSLSLMGTNFADYLREAYRVLRRDRPVHIYEATSRFNDMDAFTRGLHDLGFDVLEVEDKWKFTYIKAVKSKRTPQKDVKVQFMGLRSPFQAQTP